MGAPGATPVRARASTTNLVRPTIVECEWSFRDGLMGHRVFDGESDGDMILTTGHERSLAERWREATETRLGDTSRCRIGAITEDTQVARTVRQWWQVIDGEVNCGRR